MSRESQDVAVLEPLLELVSRLYAGERVVRSRVHHDNGPRLTAVSDVEALQHSFQRAAAMTVLDRVPFELLVLDAGCRVHFANSAASRGLDDGDPLIRSGGGVQPWLSKDTAKFESLIERTCHLQLSPPEDATIRLTRRCSSLSIGLLAIHVDAAAEGFSAVIMPDRDREHMLRRLLVTLFGFTTSEAHVALLMLQGQSIERAARQRGITRPTATAHWQSARWKIGGGADPLFVDTLLATLLLTGRPIAERLAPELQLGPTSDVRTGR